MSVILLSDRQLPPGATCCFCGGKGPGAWIPGRLATGGNLVAFGNDLVAHEFCALYSSGARVDIGHLGDDVRIGVVSDNPCVVDVASLRSERRRGKQLTCALCGLNGATVGCYACSRRSFHFPCAYRAGLVELHWWQSGHRARVVHCTEHLDPRCLVSWRADDDGLHDDAEVHETWHEGRVTDGPHEGRYLVLYTRPPYGQESLSLMELAACAKMRRPPPGAARWAAFADMCRRCGVRNALPPRSPFANAMGQLAPASAFVNGRHIYSRTGAVRVRLGGAPLDQAARVAARRPKADADAACARPLAVTEGERAGSRAVVAAVIGPAPQARGAGITVVAPTRRSHEPLPWRAGAPVLDLAAAWLQCRDVDALATTGRLGYATVKTDANRLYGAMLARDHGVKGAAALRFGCYTDARQAYRALEGASLSWAARNAPSESAGPGATSFRATLPRHDRRATVQKVGSPGASGDVTLAASDSLEGPLSAFEVEISSVFGFAVGVVIGAQSRNPSPFWLGREPCDGSAGISFALDPNEGLFHGTNLSARPMKTVGCLSLRNFAHNRQNRPQRIGVVVDRRVPHGHVLSFHVDGYFAGVGLDAADGVSLDNVRPAVSLRMGGAKATLRSAFPLISTTFGVTPYKLRAVDLRGRMCYH